MELYNITELAAGYSIVDNLDGDGLTEVTNDLYQAPSEATEDEAQLVGFFDADEGGASIDDFAMLDDRDRWAHERDGFVDAQLALARAEAPRGNDEKRDYRLIQLVSDARDHRYFEYLGVARRLAAVRRFRPDWAATKAKAVIRRLDRLDDAGHREVARRYKRTGERQWWCKPLTTEQHRHLVEALTWVVNPERRPTPMAKPELTPAPTADRDVVPGFWGEWLAWCLLTA